MCSINVDFLCLEICSAVPSHPLACWCLFWIPGSIIPFFYQLLRLLAQWELLENEAFQFSLLVLTLLWILSFSWFLCFLYLSGGLGANCSVSTISLPSWALTPAGPPFFVHSQAFKEQHSWACGSSWLALESSSFLLLASSGWWPQHPVTMTANFGPDL